MGHIVAAGQEALAVMSIRIAVSDPLPVFRRGVMATLDGDGRRVDEPDDLLAWAQAGQPAAVLLTLGSAADWALLARLVEAEPGLLVIAVLDPADEETYVKALSAGAAGAVPRGARPEAVRQVFEAAVRGTSLLPVEVVRALVARVAGGRPTGGPSGREIDWLRRLAQGVTVSQLADEVGYSERAMFRQLSDLYAKLHVRNRMEALMYGRERGWL
ncbi:LuxR C-terminal-related transcriptional regulator [[Actinomadura] parvosata]|uniref:LuxR C-terminal-related transcriptional regulator n=1 Tax=[Actinomadura] parvosata TaxID=1955412 RepID=UPI00406D4663